MSRWRVGVDSGGTFTDICLFDEQAGRIETWKVEIVLNDDDKKQVLYFSNEGLAQLAVEWAYTNHLESLRQRKDVEELQAYPDPQDASWKMKAVYGKKVSWWRRWQGGFYPIKDYFSYEKDVFERVVVG